jgi:DNA-binding LacI/PurR family transcriptional regulator
MKKSTLTDISKQTGYSISTVSSALNGKSEDYRISQKTVEKIIKAAENLKLRLGFHAQNLCKHKTYAIGLLTPHIESPFFAEIAKIIIREAQQNGYIIIVIETMGKSRNRKAYIGVFIDAQC